MSERVLPLTIVGGYLGAGKTTLINHMLRNAGGRRLAILVNEFGELPIDADLIEARDGDLISLSGGCVCCSYGNDLTMALVEMAAMDPPPDHVVLETSGVALPGAIGASVSLLPDYQVEGVAVLADAETVTARADDPYMGDTVLRQLADADIVILNKTDLMSNENLSSTEDWLSGKAPGAVIIRSVMATVPVQAVLDPQLEIDRPVAEAARHGSIGLQTWHAETDLQVDPSALAAALMDDAADVVRAKGFLQTDDGLQTFQMVGRRWSVTPAPPGAEAGLVVISRAELSRDAKAMIVSQPR